jgi:asparagine synthase (glutamine-hydrolysing)
MCGIFGFNWDSQELLRKMSEVLLHRGPDDAAFYTDKNISLGMRRLSIIDLKKGIYPVSNEDHTLQAVFNGELYNYKELKSALIKKGHRFITECDAEIIPHGYEEYGNDFFNKLNGMFAIAMYDIKNNRLILVRDMLGEKPIYYLYDKKRSRFAFASEIKALLQIPDYKKKINGTALDNYFTYRYTPGEDTLFADIKRLLPGHFLIFGTNLKIEKYWDFEFSKNKKTLAQNAKHIRNLLEDSVKIRLMSDVPLGAYLSGGLDSSAIVALMAKYSDKVNTFNVSFSGTEFDESEYAELVAERFNTNHKQIDVDIDAVKALPKVAYHLDEPIADAATIPTYLMSQETKKKVTVVLSGEGSDEIFGGYERFRHLNIAYKFRHIPKFIRALPAKFKGNPDKTIYRSFSLLSNLHDQKEAYLSYYSVFDSNEKAELYKKGITDKSDNGSFNISKYFGKTSFYNSILNIDIKERLPNNMLLKGDKMTMACSVEGRVPFLDPRLVSFSATIPFDQKVSLFQDKIVYRKAVKGLIPEEIIRRKKQGFTIPTEKWAKEGLKDHLSGLVKENREPYLNKKYIENIASNLSRSAYYKRQFWAILMYEQWYNTFMI